MATGGVVFLCQCGENGSFSCTCDLTVAGEDHCPECGPGRRPVTAPVLAEEEADRRRPTVGAVIARDAAHALEKIQAQFGDNAVIEYGVVQGESVPVRVNGQGVFIPVIIMRPIS